MNHFSIIQAICRTALINPSDALKHQINRLKISLEKNGEEKEAKAIENLLKQNSESIEMAPSRLKKSFIFHEGQELTRNTVIPVDKETSIPLAEIIFEEMLPTEPPIFNENTRLALNSIINEWLNFDILNKVNAQPSRTCLIYGPPGTGKTHLAQWLAKQIGKPVILVRLDGLMSSFLGTTSRNIGNLFTFAAKYNCILLLDEFDAIAKLRNDPQEVGEIKRVVNTLLQNLDSRKNIGFTIGITNHETLLDPAIWRRFEVQIEIPNPDLHVMQMILKSKLSSLKFDDVKTKFLSWCIEGNSGADAESLCKWMIKTSVLSESTSFLDNVRRFATLNTGRVSAKKRELLSSPEEDLMASLISDSFLNFKQKELAELFGKPQSTLSKQLSKINK